MLMLPKWRPDQYRHRWQQIGVEACLVEEVHSIPCALVFHSPTVLPQTGAPMKFEDIERIKNDQRS